MKTQTLTSVVLCVLCTVTGCSKIRHMTRGDFAVLNDPFLDSPAEASSEATRLAATAADTTQGYARIPSTSAAAQPSAAVQAAVPSGGSPFRTAGQSRTIVPESTTAGLARIAAGESSAANQTPEALLPKHAPMDMADMSAFMKEQAEASGLTETAEDLEEDFEAFMAARQENWKQESNTIRNQAANQIQQVSDEVNQFADTDWPSLPEMAYEGGQAAKEIAQPLLQDFSSQASTVAQRTQAQAAQAIAEMPNPFAEPASGSTAKSVNPFEEMAMEGNPFGASPPPQRTVQTASASQPSAGAQQSLDQQLEEFAAFAETELTGRIQTQKPAPEPNPFQLLQSRVNQPASASATNHASPIRTVTQSKPAQPAQPTVEKEAEKLDSNFVFDVGWRPANMERR